MTRFVRALHTLRPLRSVVGTALLALVLSAGCQRGGPAPGSSLEREGSRGPHRYRVRSELTPARVTLGDPATWKLRAELPSGARALGVARDSAGPWMDVTAVREPKQGSGASGAGAWEVEYRLRAFDLGRIPLPRVAVVVSWPEPRPAGAPAADTLEFPPDTMTVDSLTTARSEAIEPDRGPIRPGLRAVDLALAGLAALLLVGAIVAAIVLWRARRRAVAPETIAPPEPPEAPFQRAIGALRKDVDTLPRDVFYERLSLAVRSYVSAVTGAPALDLTTRELAWELERRGRWKSDAMRAVVRTLDRSDLAKFARHEDPLGEARSALDEASSLPDHFRVTPPTVVTEPPASPPNAEPPALPPTPSREP